MIKVHILTKCQHCNGEAYLPVGEAERYTGEKYIRHRPCTECDGSGNRPKWVSLAEFEAILAQATCKHLHTSFQGNHHFSGGDVWDDITEVCDDCGANMNQLPDWDSVNANS